MAASVTVCVDYRMGLSQHKPLNDMMPSNKQNSKKNCVPQWQSCFPIGKAPGSFSHSGKKKPDMIENHKMKKEKKIDKLHSFIIRTN